MRRFDTVQQGRGHRLRVAGNRERNLTRRIGLEGVGVDRDQSLRALHERLHGARDGRRAELQHNVRAVLVAELVVCHKQLAGTQRAVAAAQTRCRLGEQWPPSGRTQRVHGFGNRTQRPRDGDDALRRGGEGPQGIDLVGVGRARHMRDTLPWRTVGAAGGVGAELDCRAARHQGFAEGHVEVDGPWRPCG